MWSSSSSARIRSSDSFQEVLPGFHEHPDDRAAFRRYECHCDTGRIAAPGDRETTSLGLDCPPRRDSAGTRALLPELPDRNGSQADRGKSLGSTWHDTPCSAESRGGKNSWSRLCS